MLTALIFAGPSVGETQQTGKVYRIGTLASGAAAVPRFNQAFVDTLREQGFAEGQNLIMSYGVSTLTFTLPMRREE